MIQSKDYLSYIQGHKEFITMLSDNNSILYYRIKDVIYVCDYIVNFFNNNKQYQKNDELGDLELIFETGFKYLHEQLEQIKIYYENYFKKDYFLFKKYELLINYCLFVEDFSEALDEKGYLNAHRKNILSTLVKNIDKIISEREAYDEKTIEDFEQTLNATIPSKVEITTTDSIFSDIADELSIIG